MFNQSARRFRLPALLALAALLAAVFAAPASANPDPRFAFDFGSYGSGNGQFVEPDAIDVDPSGNVWVTDAWNHRVQKFNPKGEYLAQYDASPSELAWPRAIVVDDASGNVWVADYFHMVKLSSAGKYLGEVDFEEAGAVVSMPRDLAIDAVGDIWLVDNYNPHIQKFSAKGEYLGQFGGEGSGNGQFQEPTGIDIDASGNLWVVDSSNRRVQQFNPQGEYLAQFGSYGSGEGQFEMPVGIEIDSTGSIWVTDTYNNARVQKFNAKGEYLDQIGSFGLGSGQFQWPTAVAADASDDLWVVDNYKNEVQKWVP